MLTAEAVTGGDGDADRRRRRDGTEASASGGGGGGGGGDDDDDARAATERRGEAEARARFAEMSRQQQAMMFSMGPQIMVSYAAYVAAYAQAAQQQQQQQQQQQRQQQQRAGAGPGPWAASFPSLANGLGLMGVTPPPHVHRAMVMNTGEATSARRASSGETTKMKKTSRAGKKTPGVASAPRKRSTKSKEPKVCVNCKSTDTPYWRKDKDGIGSLCNACGLYLAKNDAPRPALLWRRDSASFPCSGSGSGSGSGSRDGERHDASATPPESSESDDARGAMPGVCVEKEQPLASDEHHRASEIK